MHRTRRVCLVSGGGIHPAADDIPGRYIGQQVGEDAFAKALGYFESYPVPTLPGFGSFSLVLSLMGAGAWSRTKTLR